MIDPWGRTFGTKLIWRCLCPACDLEETFIFLSKHVSGVMNGLMNNCRTECTCGAQFFGTAKGIPGPLKFGAPTSTYMGMVDIYTTEKAVDFEEDA